MISQNTMFRFAVLVSFTTALAHPAPVVAQTVDFDLAVSTGQTLPASGLDTRFRVVNRMPGKEYQIAVVDRVMEIDNFVLKPDAKTAGGTKCSDLLAGAQTLQAPVTEGGPKDEADVGKRVGEIDKSLAAGDCTDTGVVQSIQVELAKTRLDVPGVYRVASGHEVVLTVTRKDNDKTLTWTLTMQGASRGKWVTTYGLAFAPNEDREYFPKPDANQKFIITQQSKPGGLKPLPALFFTWLPRSRQDKDVAYGPTAGFGLAGGSRPAAFLGFGVTYNWNLGLIAGITAVPEKRLNGRYTEGQTVTENLSDDALHETVVRARWMVALTFRFGSNPFVEATPATKK